MTKGKSRKRSPHHSTRPRKVYKASNRDTVHHFAMDKRALLKQLFGSDSEESGGEEDRERRREWKDEGRRPPPGTSIQRSDRNQARKAAIFLATPPPPPPRARGPPATAPHRRVVSERRSQPEPSTSASSAIAPPPPDSIPVCAAATRATADPTLPLSVRVHLPNGETIEVPYFAAHKSRKYRARTPTGRWLIRFDHRGRQRSCKRVPDPDPP